MKVGLNNEKSRKEWLAKKLSALPKGARILDAGAGELANKIYCEHLDYVSQDFCQYQGQGDLKGLQMGKWDTTKIDIISDITCIPSPDSSFDAILCSEVLEHVPYPEKTLAEFSRLLKAKGTLVITAPFCSLTHFSPFHYSTGFNRYFYDHHLKELGFEVMEVTANGNYFEYMGQEVRRLSEMSTLYCNYNIGFFQRFVLKFMLRLLQVLSVKDKGSSEVLCFGYGIVAKKL